jgi:DNA-binding transcriptional LysR family regulator
MAFTPLNSLNAFIAVARRLSYARASKDLGVSTSALSQSVRQLEARLGVPLLTRTSRSVALTDAGRRLLETAGPALEQALVSLENVSAPPGEVTGRVRLTVPTAAVSMILTRLLPEVLERHPQISVDVTADDQFVDIVTGGFDGGIRLVEAIDHDMVHVRLTAPCRLVVAGAPAYLERRGVPQQPTDLLQHNCIGVRRAATREPWAWEFERGKKSWKVPVRGSVTTNDPQLRRAMALAGIGLLYGLEPLLAEEVDKGRLRLVLEPYAPSVPGLFLYFPSRSQVSPAFRAFVDVAREVAGAEATRARAPSRAPGRAPARAATRRRT